MRSYDLLSPRCGVKQVMELPAFLAGLTDRDRKLMMFQDDAPCDDGMPYDQWERIRSERSLLLARLMGRELPDVS